MHGNTIKSANGFKTRPFNNIFKEVKRVLAVHQIGGKLRRWPTHRDDWSKMLLNVQVERKKYPKRICRTDITLIVIPDLTQIKR